MSKRFHGVFTALTTPFTEDGSAIDFRRLESAIDRQAAAGVAGVVPCGTTGESPTLSESEQRRLIEHAVAIAHPLGLAVIAGTGSNATAHAVEMHRFAAAVGADASLQVVPYYNKPSQAGLVSHFRAVADAADLPVVLYNIPGRCGRGLSIESIIELDAHPNIVAIKDAAGDLELTTAVTASTGLDLLSGDDTLTLPMASVGGVGVVSVVSNIVPQRVAALCNAFLGEGWSSARAIHIELFDLARGLLSLDVNPVPVKTALALLGADSGVVRPPLAPASAEVTASIARLLETHGLTPRLAVTA